MQNELITTGLISDIQDITMKKLKAQTLLSKLEIELKESILLARINKGKEHLKELEQKETEIRNQGIKILQDAGIDKFESAGVEVRIKTTAGKLIVTEQEIIPEEFIKTTTKTTTSVDKKKIKEAIKEGEIIDGVILEQDTKLIIKHT